MELWDIHLPTHKVIDGGSRIDLASIRGRHQTWRARKLGFMFPHARSLPQNPRGGVRNFTVFPPLAMGPLTWPTSILERLLGHD
jgi:hypothetical protein